ncbi:DUF6620 family protein [Actinomyces wuliandei]|uniref:DUF6620 family protein n=1 Tax=Actinomyces wuliandei TaxID=2057743 RepID=UPI000FDB69AE|nr:DUF6620 family protein [Actinomyces wuliandei]
MSGYSAESYYRLDLPHGFSRPMNVGVPGEEMVHLHYPQVPTDLPPGAAEYAQAWWQTWSPLLDGHIDVARAAEAGNIPQAEQLLYNWEQSILRASADAHQMGDFQGGRTLVVGSDEIEGRFADVVDALREFMRVRTAGGDDSEAVGTTHLAIGDLHIDLNRFVALFLASPTVTVTAQVEEVEPADQPESAWQAGPVEEPKSAWSQAHGAAAAGAPPLAAVGTDADFLGVPGDTPGDTPRDIAADIEF